MLPAAVIRIILVAAAVVVALPAKAEIQKFLQVCGGGTGGEPVKLCPSFKLKLTAPNGWSEDKEASEQQRVQILLPKGKRFGDAAALMYVRVFSRNKEQAFPDYIRVSQDRWRASVPDTKITPLPDVERANSKPGFASFAYENPSRRQQAFEYVSYGVDHDPEGNEFAVMIVMTGATKKALEQTSAAYKAFLRAH